MFASYYSIREMVKKSINDRVTIGSQYKLTVEADFTDPVCVLYMGYVHTLSGSDMVLFNSMFTSQTDNHRFLLT